MSKPDLDSQSQRKQKRALLVLPSSWAEVAAPLPTPQWGGEKVGLQKATRKLCVLKELPVPGYLFSLFDNPNLENQTSERRN